MFNFTNSIRILVGAVLVLWSAPRDAVARDLALSAGFSTTASRNLTQVAFMEVARDPVPVAGISWQPVVSLGIVAAREEHADLDRNVAVVAAGFRLVDWWRRAFFSFQFGFANRKTAALSSHAQFVSSVGWEGDRLRYTLRHVSNGDLFGGKNLGETMLLVGWRIGH